MAIFVEKFKVSSRQVKSMKLEHFREGNYVHICIHVWHMSNTCIRLDMTLQKTQILLISSCHCPFQCHVLCPYVFMLLDVKLKRGTSFDILGDTSTRIMLWQVINSKQFLGTKYYPLLHWIFWVVVGQYDPAEQNISPLLLTSAQISAPPHVWFGCIGGGW